MDVEVGGHGALHLVEERAELGARCRSCSSRCGGVEGGEGGRAVALVVAAPLRLARPHGQHRLGAVERLDLALLVDAEHQRGVAHLVDELRVARQLEALDPVRLQAEGAPDTTVVAEMPVPGPSSGGSSGSHRRASSPAPASPPRRSCVADLARRAGPRLSSSPPSRLSAKRARHRPTVRRETPNFSAIAQTVRRSKAMIRVHRRSPPRATTGCDADLQGAASSPRSRSLLQSQPWPGGAILPPGSVTGAQRITEQNIWLSKGRGETATLVEETSPCYVVAQ